MARLIALASAVVVLAGCVPTKVTSAPTRTEYSTQTITRQPSSSAAPTFRPPPATTVAPLPPGQDPARGEVEKACPYLPSSPETANGGDNVADIIGSHVLRTTVLTTTRPAGCRFYFYAGPFQAIADIVPRTFASSRAAYAAMLATSAAGGDATGVPDLVRGIDAVLFRTRFFGPDGARDWACAFAAGRTLVLVHSQRDDTSYSARELARAIAPKFR